MFRTGEAENRVVHRNQEVSMGSFETAGQRSLVQIFDDIVANELPKLAWRNPHTTLVADHFSGMFARAGQTDASKNLALNGNLHRSNGFVYLIKDAQQYTHISTDYKIIRGSLSA